MKKVINTAELLPPFEKLFHREAMKNILLRSEAQKLARKLGDVNNLFIFVGSSGAGRDTILEMCLQKFENVQRLRRTTTRRPREYVQDQDRMIFVTEKAFLRDFKNGAILFAGRYSANNQLYGISKKEINKLQNDQHSFHFLEENFSGLPLKIMFPKSKLIIVLPPTIEVLKNRLHNRDKSKEENDKRLKTSVAEIKAVLKNINQMVKNSLVDIVIVNDGIPEEVGKRITDAIQKGETLIDNLTKLDKSLKRNNYNLQ